jgi:hypothetical protein
VLKVGHGGLGDGSGSAAGCGGAAGGLQQKWVKTALQGGTIGAFAGPGATNPGGFCGVLVSTLRVIGHCDGLRDRLPKSRMGCHKKDSCNNCARERPNYLQAPAVRQTLAGGSHRLHRFPGLKGETWRTRLFASNYEELCILISANG